MEFVRGGSLAGNIRWPRLVEAAVVLAIAVPALAQKLVRYGTFGTGPDGSFYMDVAQHLIAGDGLVTSLSLYHQGYPVLPHPTSVQPLWPLVLSAAGSVMPLTTAATAVPTALWFVTLALAFLWGRRVAPSVVPKWRGRTAPDHVVHGGHVALAMMALAPDFAGYTSRPYTEGLSFALLFACLLRAPTLFGRRSVLAGIELGVWLALLFYARSQLFVAVLAMPCVLVWHLVRDRQRRGETLRFAVVACAAFWLAFLPELWWVGRFVDGSALLAYLRFDQSGEASALSDVRGLRAGVTMLETLRDRLGGVLVAFGEEGYRTVFGWIIYVVPVALGALVAAPRRRWRDLCDLVDRHGLAFVTAVGAALLLHVMHKDVGHEWWFGDRHALLGVLFFLFSLFLCVRAGGMFGWIAIVLFATTTFASAVDAWPTRSRRPFRPLAYRLEAQARLIALDEREPGQLIVAVPSGEARLLAWLVPGVGFHAIVDQTTLADLEYMVEELGVDHVVTIGEHTHPAIVDPEFEERFEEIDRFHAPEQKTKKPSKARKPVDLVRIYRPRFLTAVGRGPSE